LTPLCGLTARYFLQLNGECGVGVCAWHRVGVCAWHPVSSMCRTGRAALCATPRRPPPPSLSSCCVVGFDRRVGTHALPVDTEVQWRFFCEISSTGDSEVGAGSGRASAGLCCAVASRRLLVCPWRPVAQPACRGV
jgi:hypothetical protein